MSVPLSDSRLLVLCFVAAAAVVHAAESGGQSKREPLPNRESFRSGVFFRDAFRDGLIGKRPASLGAAGRPTSSVDASQRDEVPETKSSEQAWSQIISADTLEDEVKALAIEIVPHVQTLGRFSSGGYQEARRIYSELAVLFAVIAEFDKKVRWTKEAPTMRDRFSRAAANAKVTSVQAFNESKQRRLDLQELVRGGSIPVSPASQREAAWDHLADRSPLMERFTKSHDEGLAIWTATETSFKANHDSIQREAQLLRMFATVLAREGMSDADDDDYVAHCRSLARAADAVLQAVQGDDATSARRATSAIGKSCVQCHDDYRG